MTRDVVFTVPVEITLHLPEHRDDGTGSVAIFLLEGGGSWVDDDGVERGFGMAGGSLAAYLPGETAVSIRADKMVDAALAHLRIAAARSEHPYPETTACRICWNTGIGRITATRVAPRYTGGDDDEPAEWIPICEAHVVNWYDGVDLVERLPMFTLPEVAS